LNAGDEFLQIDDTKVVDAEIEIPQGDISLVKPGAKVRLRPWSEGNGEIVGSVTAVAPSAMDKVHNEIFATKRRIRNTELVQRPASRERPLVMADADKTRGGGAIRVAASVPNAETLLRSAMTGYAKISGPEMTVGEAYLRLCARFLTVELWSWVP
jgi:HlyD family secretion protein